MPRGGKRPNSGPKPGTVYKPTREKAIAREALRAIIDRHMEAMTEAQIKSATGIQYLVKRARNGKFEKVTEAGLDAALKGQDENDLILEVWDERPNTQAYIDLMNRHIDKPTEHHDITAEVSVKGYKWQD